MKKNKKSSFKNHKGFGIKILKILRFIDLFGKNITLSYNGQDKYKSSWGGILSAILIMFLLGFFSYLLNQLITRSNPTISTATLQKDIKSSSEDLDLNNFNFAFTYTANGTDYTLDKSVVNVRVLHYVQTWINTTTSKTIRTFSALEYDKWNGAFDSISKTDASRIGINNYYWVKNSNYSIAGTYYSPTFKYINLQMIRCRNSTTWRSDDEIDSIIKNGRFSVSKINSYVNLYDYNQPIHYFIDDGLYWDLVPNMRKWTNVYLRENTASFQDDFFQIRGPDISTYSNSN